MELIRPSHQILEPIDPKAIMEKLEACGRTAYKSEDKITPGSADRFISAIVRRGHESVIEHVNISVKFICDRGVTHELVRHRLVSYTQESTRYCNYGKLGVRFVQPDFTLEADDLEFLRLVEAHYNRKLSQGKTPQQARYFLPNGLKTEIVCTANLREWRHILRLRTNKVAHPQMRQLMIPLLLEFRRLLPVLFNDIGDTDT